LFTRWMKVSSEIFSIKSDHFCRRQSLVGPYNRDVCLCALGTAFLSTLLSNYINTILRANRLSALNVQTCVSSLVPFRSAPFRSTPLRVNLSRSRDFAITCLLFLFHNFTHNRFYFFFFRISAHVISGPNFLSNSVAITRGSPEGGALE
jgi:hypothetical protein